MGRDGLCCFLNRSIFASYQHGRQWPTQVSNARSYLADKMGGHLDIEKLFFFLFVKIVTKFTVYTARKAKIYWDCELK